MTAPAASVALDPPVRDAATVILLRRDGAEPRLLMGQRGRSAVFMPSKFVFPGGAVDPDDTRLPLDRPLRGETRTMLARQSPGCTPEALALAAIRELWEETGLPLAGSGPWDVPDELAPDWQSFRAAGHAPAADGLNFVFRAITPPGRPRRFDARFFLVEAERIPTDLDDFSGACDELSHLAWVSLAEARRLDLPFITEVVLGEVAARLDDPAAIRPAPFFHHADGRSFIDAV
ncbi:MAG: DNA mismatch repair protein MutT [Paracoccaceae bacterium]